MKNLVIFFFLASVILFSSCAKESIILPELNETSALENQNVLNPDKEEGLETPFLSNAEQENISASVILQIQVSRITEQQLSGQYLIDFSANYDFTEIILEDTQHLDFTDANGNPSTLTFSVNDFAGDVNSLSVNFAIGSNSLSGLTFLALQEVIVEDIIMN